MYPNTGVADCQEAKHRANGECDSTSMHWATFSIFTKRNRSQAFDWHNNRQAVDQDFDSDSDGKAVVSEGSNGNDLFKDLARVNV